MKLYMMIGLSGCGKSTYAKKLAEQENTLIFSSDALREELYGNENIQGDNSEVFNELHRRIISALKENKNVIYDATNINSKKRRAFLSTIKHLNCEKIAILMATPYEDCLKRNSERERKVPEEIIKRQYMNFNVPCKQEGFDKIEIIYPKDCKFYSCFELVKSFKDIPHDNHHHTTSIGDHMEAALQYLKECIYKDEGARFDATDTPLYVATLCHDIGKPFCKVFTDKHGNPTEEAHFYGHQNVGAYMSLFLNTFINNLLEIALLIQYHMNFYLGWEESENAMQRDKEFLGRDIFDKLLILHECDLNAHQKVV